MEKIDLPARARPGDRADGMALLAGSLADAVGAAGMTDAAHALYASAGRRMAAAVPLAGVRDVAGFGAAINAFWRSLDWGEAEIVVEPGAFVLRHRHPPRTLPGDGGACWPDMLLALLEGAYDGWFRALGSGPALRTRARWCGEIAEIRHGA